MKNERISLMLHCFTFLCIRWMTKIFSRRHYGRWSIGQRSKKFCRNSQSWPSYLNSGMYCILNHMSNNIATINDLTWPEVQDYLQQGCKIAILPFGHTEQHGPHLPFGMDTYFISAVTKMGAELANKEAGKPIALVFPTMPFGNGGKFADGELRLRPSTFMAVFNDLIKEVEEQGFTKVVLASGHGSNGSVMGNALNEAYWNG